MSLILVFSVQVAAVATPAAPAPPPASAVTAPRWAMPVLAGADGGSTLVAFDLARYRSQDGGGCAGGGGVSDVLVCGPRRHGGDYPIDHWARIFGGPDRPVRAETNLGGGLQGRAYLEDVPMDRGAISHRALIGVRTRF